MSDKSKKDTSTLSGYINEGVTMPKPQPQKLAPKTTAEIKEPTATEPNTDKNER